MYVRAVTMFSCLCVVVTCCAPLVAVNERLGVGASIQERTLEMLRESSRRIAALTANWIRVGFCQGNFNR